MTRRFLLLLVLAFLLPTAVSVRAGSWIRVGARAHHGGPYPSFKPGEVVVQFATATSESHVSGAIVNAGGLKARKSAFGERYVVTLEAGVSVDKAVQQFRAMPDVE